MAVAGGVLTVAVRGQPEHGLVGLLGWLAALWLADCAVVGWARLRAVVLRAEIARSPR